MRGVASEPEIIVARERMASAELARLVRSVFKDMVKFVVDVESGAVAVGGELHADAEQVLLEQGSRQSDLWGGNYFPGRGSEGCIEYTSLINIRPSQGNPSMVVEPADLRERIRVIVSNVLGEGEALR